MGPDDLRRRRRGERFGLEHRADVLFRRPVGEFVKEDHTAMVAVDGGKRDLWIVDDDAPE